VRAQMESDDETAELEERHADLASRLAAKHKERDRWLHLYAQGHILEDELEIHLADLRNLIDNLKLLLSSVENDLAAKREEVELAESTEAWLLMLRERLSEVEEDTEEAFEKRCQLVKLLVAGITAGRDEEGELDVRITYRFGPPESTPDEDTFVGGVHSPRRSLPWCEVFWWFSVGSTDEGEDQGEGGDGEGCGGEVGAGEAEGGGGGRHKEWSNGLSCAESHAVCSYEGAAVLGWGVVVEEGEDVGDIDPLGHAEEDCRDGQKPQTRGERDGEQGDGVEDEGHFEKGLL
jgi:hypothetical protein